MKSTFAQWGLMAVLIASLAGCNGGGGASSAGAGSVAVENEAAKNPSANDPAKNPQAPWNALVALGVAPVTLQSPPVVNFAVLDSSGKHVPGLKLIAGDTACGGSNVQLLIAAFDGSNWQSLISSQANATGGGTVAVATTDPISGATLQENASSGYYTYHFSTSVVAVKDSATIHRVGIRLCYVDPQTKAVVKVNPYLDFTLGADGIGNPVKDGLGKPTAARQVVDKSSCNECHQALSAQRHEDGFGDGFIDPNVCVICHNPGSTDYATGNALDLKSMVHRIHRGKQLANDYQFKTLVVRKKDSVTGTITGVDYPQERRNCVKCHDNSKAQNADNWMKKPSRNACWGCHDDRPAWNSIHAATLCPSSTAACDTLADSVCRTCHVDGPVLIASAHVIRQWAGNYQYNIDAVTWNPDRTVSVKFSVSNPDGTVFYDVKGPGFANLQLLFGWGSGDYTNAGARDAAGTLIPRGQPVSLSAASAAPLGNNRFQMTSTPLPASASGTGVVALTGSVTDPGYPAPVKDAVSYFAIGGSGPVVPRRTVVSTGKCNVCHGKNINMGNHVPSHGGNSTETEVCVICHNGNNVLNGTTVAGGKVTVQPDSAHFKRLIHMKHKAMGANFPAMPRTNGSSNGSFIGYTGIRMCNVCHVNGSYKNDLGVMGSSTLLDVLADASGVPVTSSNATITDTDPSNNLVISPRAAACSACHADDTAKNHMINVGGAVFGTVTQGELGAKVYEGCYGCHAPGGVAPVDVVHGQQ